MKKKKKKERNSVHSLLCEKCKYGFYHAEPWFKQQ